jgi:hypothetical protein
MFSFSIKPEAAGAFIWSVLDGDGAKVLTGLASSQPEAHAHATSAIERISVERGSPPRRRA